jgi:uncharacterized membrane protein
MRPSPLHFFPLAWPFVLALLVLAVVVIGLIEIGVLEYAYERIGISRRYAFMILLLSLVGSYVNIPVAQFPAERVITGQEVLYFGMLYVIPVEQQWPGTIVAVNVGGAMIPIALSVHLILANKLYLETAAGVTIVAVIVHLLAHPLAGVGIAVPVFLPPLVAAGSAFVLARRSRPALAYIAGSLGTLIGADLTNLGAIPGLGAPVASIGGAGTFDGIFLTGILAVLLA